MLCSLSSIQGDPQIPRGFPFPVVKPRNSLKVGSWGSYEAHLTHYTLGTATSCCVMTVVLKTTIVVHVFFLSIIVSFWKVNPVTVSPLWQETGKTQFPNHTE